jgi:hypothetical protein
MHFWYAMVDAKLRLLTLNPFKWCAFFQNDKRSVAVRYGALKNSDKKRTLYCTIDEFRLFEE